MTRFLEERGVKSTFVRGLRVRGDAILRDDAIISPRLRMTQRRFDTNIGLNTREHDHSDPARREIGVERGADEAVVAPLVDHRLV